MNPDFLVMLLHEATPMRSYMMDMLTDADLAVRVPGNPTLGEVCQAMGNVERFYIDSFKTQTFRMDAPEDESPETAASIEKLKAWYDALDAEFESVLRSFSESELDARIVERNGHPLPAAMHYHSYHEAMLIFCAKCSVYLRMMGKPLNDQWLDWIG